MCLPLTEARANEELVSLSDSQTLRFIDELNGLTGADERAREIRSKIRHLKKKEHSIVNRNEIRRLYEELDKCLLKPDYICVIMANKKDYLRACKGFKINGVEYSRLVGTNGGVKNKTIVFVSSLLVDELRRRIDNGRNPETKLIPAKFEAYRALTCSGSTPVSLPKGIAVVNDCITKFNEDVIYINDEDSDEPKMTIKKNTEIELNESDGYGLILPSLAKRWSEELKLDYVASGFNTRFPFEKGMVFPFDFIEFADKVANKYIIKDAWGNDVDIRNVEMILTTSMVKLWDSYESCESYIENSLSNNYTFSVTKVAPDELENERDLNYQFIQSYNLNETQINELIKPTIDEIKDVLSGDYRKAILFLKGSYMTAEDARGLNNDYVKAMMIDKQMFNDQFVREKIYKMIKQKINDAKIGVVKVHGNYSILCGDPYSLCQSIFGMKVTGLLRAGEIYNQYWDSDGTDEVVCFRAPMTCHNNIVKRRIARGEDMRHWYQYIKTCTLLNSWDTTCDSLNGADKDGDIIFITNNSVLINNHKPTKSIMCIQRKGIKVIPTEKNLIEANLNSFGDDIGKTTNYITSMFDVRSQFSPDSEEYQILDYRIKCGQLFQQNAIDRAKGIISKPMPKYWHNYHECLTSEEIPEEKRELYLRIVADKKPYFMTYIYPTLKKEYTTFNKKAQERCIREFRIRFDNLSSLSENTLTDNERAFIYNYNKYLPVGNHPCVMNQICRNFENEFNNSILKYCSCGDFNSEILKSDCEYSQSRYEKIKKLYNEHSDEMRRFKIKAARERTDGYVRSATKSALQKEFTRKCLAISSSEDEIANIAVDLCYHSNKTKQFAWDIASNIFIRNLLEKNNYIVNIPVKANDGDITYCGEKYKLISVDIRKDDAIESNNH